MADFSLISYHIDNVLTVSISKEIEVKYIFFKNNVLVGLSGNRAE